jgi:uridine kinase
MNSYDDLLNRIQKLKENRECVSICIDGRCASGKTSLALYIQKHLGGNVFHMDDFFLRPEQRTSERYAEPGGNVDYERFLQEVLIPISKNEDIVYCPFDCSTMSLGKPAAVNRQNINIIEGSYSMRPELLPYYDLKVFLHTAPEVQLERLQNRNAEKLNDFKEKWIPMEEKYFLFYKTEKEADMCIDTSDMF